MIEYFKLVLVIGAILVILFGINIVTYGDDLLYKDKCEELGGKFTGEFYQLRHCSFPNYLGIYDEANRFSIGQIKDLNEGE